MDTVLNPVYTGEVIFFDRSSSEMTSPASFEEAEFVPTLSQRLRETEVEVEGARYGH